MRVLGGGVQAHRNGNAAVPRRRAVVIRICRFGQAADLPRRCKVRTPGFTAEHSLYQSSRHYHGRGASRQDGMVLAPAITFPKILFDCQRFPALCNLVLSVPSIKVSWVPFNDGVSGLVIVTGSGFTASSQVKVDIGNC